MSIQKVDSNRRAVRKVASHGIILVTLPPAGLPPGRPSYMSDKKTMYVHGMYTAVTELSC